MVKHNRWSIGRNLLFVAIIAMIAPLFIRTTAKAQDFGQLLKAVDKMEANLKAMVEKESVAREEAIAELRDGMEQPQSGGNPAWQKKISDELATLRTQIKELAGAQSSQELAGLVNDVEFLKAENLYLRGVIDKNSEQYVSVDGEYAAPNNETLEQLNQKVLSLNERIEDIAAPKKAPSKPSGSKTTINGRLYSHGMVNFDSDNGNSEFGVSRAYVTLKSKLADYAGLRVTTDLKNIDDKYNIILKYAYLDWKPGFTNGLAKVRLGLQATQYIDYMNKLWGRRYLEKTVSDQRKFLTSSDLGISAIVGFGHKSKYGFASLALLNGTSYSHVEELNDRKDFNFVTLAKPFKNVEAFSHSAVMFQFYSGAQNKALDDLVSVDTASAPWDTTVTTVSASDWKRQIVSVGGLLAWNSTIDAGLDLNFTTVGEGALNDAVKKRGLSFFSTFYLKKLATHSAFARSLNFFGRLDFYDPNTDKADDGQSLMIVGVESTPVKGFKVSLNYRSTKYQDETTKTNNKLYMNTLFKF